MDGGDDGYPTGLDGGHRRLHGADVAVERGVAAGLAGGPAAGREERTGHRLEVETNREVLSLSRQDDATDLGHRAERLDSEGEVRPELRPHGIAGLRSVQSQDADVTLDLDAHDR